MKGKLFRNFFELPAPILSLTLIGVLLLSALIYYRAVKIQRFLEPALALSTPRITFAKNVKNLLFSEFGIEHAEHILFTSNSLYVDKTLLLPGTQGQGPDSAVIEKLGRIFLSVLKDPDMRGYVDFIMISAKFPAGADAKAAAANRVLSQRQAEAILTSLFRVSPELQKEYGAYFAASALPAMPADKEGNLVEFRLLPSERLHIDVLRSLQKYAH